jgi:hypothetical protein
MTGPLQFSDCMLLLQNGMQLPNVRALRGSRNCTESSNPSCSATQSEVQRNPPGLLWKLQEMGAIPQLLLANRTGKSVLLIAAGKLCSLFLRRASEQSGFKDSVRRMQCDHKSMTCPAELIRRALLLEIARAAI